MLWPVLFSVALALPAPAPTPADRVQSRSREHVGRYTIEQFFATRATGDADWSPDGEQVVFVSNISGRDNLWIVPAQGGWPSQLTVSEERQDAPTWSPDGRWIAFQSDHHGDEQWDLFVVSPEGGEVRNLTRTREVAEQGPLWSPDSRRIAYAVKPRAAPNHELALWDLAAGSGRPLTRGTPADYSLYPVAFVPGGKWLLAGRMHASDKDGDAVLVDLATGTVRVLTPHSGEQVWRPADVSPDGAWVLLTSDAKNGYENVALLDLRAALAQPARSKAPARLTWVTEERWEMTARGFSPDGRWLLYSGNLDGTGALYAYRLSDRRRERLPVGGGSGDFAGSRSSYSPDGTRVLVRRSAADSPGDLHVYDLNAATAKRITQGFVGGVRPDDMVEPELVRYPSRDGLEISAFLYMPWNLKKDGSNPAVVWIHGGPTSQSLNSFNRSCQFLANQGYIVLAPNYRGSTGYGRAFMDANRFDMGGGDLADVVAGTGFLKRTGYVDPRKIVAAGGSYGGYLTMCAVTMTPEAWAAGVALYPFVNWFTEMENEDPLLRQYDLATMGDPRKNQALLRERSPIFHLDRIRAPLFMTAGGNDPRCPPSEAQQVADEMKKRGMPCEFALYPDEGHGFSRREDLFDAYRRVIAFLDRNVKGVQR
jgi:dipeptidyl aminopeptidase/acylaminoacyl peptidase